MPAQTPYVCPICHGRRWVSTDAGSVYHPGLGAWYPASGEAECPGCRGTGRPQCDVCEAGPSELELPTLPRRWACQTCVEGDLRVRHLLAAATPTATQPAQPDDSSAARQAAEDEDWQLYLAAIDQSAMVR